MSQVLSQLTATRLASSRILPICRARSPRSLQVVLLPAPTTQPTLCPAPAQALAATVGKPRQTCRPLLMTSCARACTKPLLACHQTKSTMTTSANFLVSSAVFLMELNATVLPPTVLLETMVRTECATQISSSAGPSTTTTARNLHLGTLLPALSLAQQLPSLS